MPLRHTVYCPRSIAAVTPEMLQKQLGLLDYLTLGEDYGLAEDAVRAALPLRITNLAAAGFYHYQLSYGQTKARPVMIDRWETEEQRQAATDEKISNLTVRDQARAQRIIGLLRQSVDSVSISFGVDPPAAMFAWEVARYFAAESGGIIEADDGAWLTIDDDYQPQLV